MNSSTNDGTSGYLLFAHNNNSIDYAGLALCNALLIKKHCKQTRAVALITDEYTQAYLDEHHGSDLVSRAFDHVIIDSLDHRQFASRRYHDTRYTTFSDEYHNSNRPNALRLSPFDETMMVDVDYLILDDTLDMIWGSVEDFMCNTKTIDLDHKANNFGFDNRFNDMSIPLYWATAVYFKKTPLAERIFELMEFVREHYVYYQYLYRFMPSGYTRNDYALSIAIHMLNNMMEYQSVATLPVPHILFSMENDELHDFRDGTCIITTEPEQGDFRVHAVRANVHMMNKRAIARKMPELISYAIS